MENWLITNNINRYVRSKSHAVKFTTVEFEKIYGAVVEGRSVAAADSTREKVRKIMNEMTEINAQRTTRILAENTELPFGPEKDAVKFVPPPPA